MIGLSLVLLLGLLRGAESICDSTCYESCRKKIDGCTAQFYADRRPAQSAQESYNMSTTKLDTPDNTRKALQAACNDHDKNVFDSCSALTQLSSCFAKEVPPLCQEDERLAKELSAWTAGRGESCGMSSSCYNYDLLKCQCRVMKNYLSDPLGSICTGYVDFAACVHNIPERCYDEASDFQYTVRYLTAAYSTYFYLRCAPSACPKAVDCTSTLATPPPPNNYTGLSLGDGFLYVWAGIHNIPAGFLPDTSLPTVCGKTDVFDCLKNATKECNTSLGNVTFDDVKISFSQACSPAVKPVLNCSDFTQCLKTFEPKPVTAPGQIPTVDNMHLDAVFVASATRTKYWCSWLKHNYQCAINHTQTCAAANSTLNEWAQKRDALTCGGATAAPVTGCDKTCEVQCWSKYEECANKYTTALAPYQASQQAFLQQQISQNTSLSKLGNMSMALQHACNNISANLFDTCKALTEVKSCLDSSVSKECYIASSVGESLAKLRADAEKACQTEENCYAQDLLKCQCKVLKDVTKPQDNICTGYSEMKTCMASLPQRCTQNDDVNKTAAYASAIYAGYNYLHCGANACPSAVECLKPLDTSEEMPSEMDSGAPAEDGYIHVYASLDLMPKMDYVPDVNMLTICPIPTQSGGQLSVFDCLKNASTTCKINQGTVTMDSLKTAYNSMCTETLPQTMSLATCDPFGVCLKSFPGLLPFDELDQMGDVDAILPAEQVNAVFTYIANTTRSAFWCNWLKHNYQCGIVHGAHCGLNSTVISFGTQKRDALNCSGAATPPPPGYEATTAATAKTTPTGAASSVGTNICMLLTAVAMAIALFQ